MRHNLTSLISLLMILVISGKLSAASDQNVEVPWDTVIAELQVINAMKQPDSVKAALTQALFDKYDLQAEDYSRFYNNFLAKSPEQQLTFLKKVENVILEMLKQKYEVKPEESKRE